MTLLFRRDSDLDPLFLRLDMVIPGIEAKRFREAWVKPWSQVEAYNSIFGEGAITSYTELEEFRVDEEAEEIRCYHVREPIPLSTEEVMYRDVVNLSAKGEMVLGKSTLQLSPGRGPPLSQLLVSPDVMNKRTKVMAQQTSLGCLDASKADPVDLGICGTAQVFFGCRTTTTHGDVGDVNSLYRAMSVGCEGALCWNEILQSANPNTAGPCTRFILVGLVPSDYHFQGIGGVNDFVDRCGRIGPNCVSALQKVLTCVYANSAAKQM